MFDRIHLWGHWPWAFICWRIFDHSYDFSACDRKVYIFYFFLVQFCTFIRTCAFPPGCLFYCHIFTHNSLLLTLYSSVVTSFSFLILLFRVFFSWWIWLMVCQFSFIFSKNYLLVLLAFAIVSFISFFIYFCSGHYHFFPSTIPFFFFLIFFF